ncbi:MAG: hypothetical protein KatS3mg062_0026 [Tepidiforma sp.]|nr:MAG: hypothetical protein KatS3mg062_0026 [Tepidiforma sp.]
MDVADFRVIEERLETAAFLDCRPVWYSSNYVFLARLQDPAGELLAIYKPRDGEAPLWDFPAGTLYRREVAAFRLANLLGWQLVPPTVVREGPSGVGSLQVFVHHDPQQHYFVQRENPSLWPQLQRLCLFDFVANNADRKGGHCLLDESGRIWAIDNGLCFNAQYKLRTVVWDWAGEPLPDWLADELRAAVDALGREAHAALAGLLSDLEIEAVVRRGKQLVQAGRFPVPGETRHYPWPLV